MSDPNPSTARAHLSGAPPSALASPIVQRIADEIGASGGWMGFDRFMAMALYEPGIGYYAGERPIFGRMPDSGGDFVTAPELSPLFARTLAVQVEQVLNAAAVTRIVEFGAGSGALAEGLLDALGGRVSEYAIVDLPGRLRERQRERLARFGARVRWLDQWPASIEGVVIGNEVLDAMPVQLLHWDGGAWFERGVVLADSVGGAGGEAASLAPAPRFALADRPTGLRPPHDGPFAPGTVTEIHRQAEAFIAGLGARMSRGAAFFIDYGFPAAEYYHPQRAGGTLACHRGHRVDFDPLADVGEKDISAHVNFTGIALAGQDAGLDVAGYASQGRFLLNCGIASALAAAAPSERADGLKLVAEHEMGELFKVIAFVRGCEVDPIGFASGDRMHRL